MKKILIVEDDTRILEILRKILGKNYHVITCSHKDEALILIGQDGLDFDLVITDWDNPTLAGGAEIIKAVHEHLPNTPVIVMTGDPGNEKLIREVHNPDDFIAKPFRFDALQSMVNIRLALAKTKNGQ